MASHTTELKPPEFDSIARDRYYWDQLAEVVEKRQYSIEDMMRNWSAYVMRRDLIRFIAHYELFRKVADLPGHIVELGIYRGASFFTWGNLLETFCPFDRHRTAIGFDSFEGLSNFRKQDGADSEGQIVPDNLVNRYVGGFRSTAWESERLCEMHNADSMILGTRRSRIVVGDIMQTLPKFVEENPGMRLSLVHFDVDLYEPTKIGLELLYPLVVPGGVICFDEYGFLQWPGESKAVDEFLQGLPVMPTLRKFPFAQAPSYIVK